MGSRQSTFSAAKRLCMSNTSGRLWLIIKCRKAVMTRRCCNILDLFIIGVSSNTPVSSFFNILFVCQSHQVNSNRCEISDGCAMFVM